MTDTLNKAAIKRLADKAVKEERALATLKNQFALENKEFAKFLKKQDEINRKITTMWNEIKAVLVDAGYTDVIENENFRVSISKVLGIKVVDVDKLPKDYTETVKIAKSDKLKKHYELYGTLPDGTVDNSYYRLVKKVK